MAGKMLTCVFCGGTMPMKHGEYRVVGIVRADGPAPMCAYGCRGCIDAGKRLQATPRVKPVLPLVQMALPLMEAV